MKSKTMSTGVGKRTQRQRGHEFKKLGHEYPDNWPEIAKRIKDAAGWECERCGHPHDVDAGYMLTVAHMIPDKANVEDWNLAALCQRCHLHCQHEIDFEQGYMFEHPEWIAWRWEAFITWRQNRTA